MVGSKVTTFWIRQTLLSGSLSQGWTSLKKIHVRAGAFHLKKKFRVWAGAGAFEHHYISSELELELLGSNFVI